MNLWPIALERPIALALVPFWFALWWWLRQQQRRPEVWSGAIEFWRASLPESAHDAAREGPRTPRWIVWALVGLVAGTLALAGPRSGSAGPTRVLRIYLEPGRALWLDRDAPEGRWQRARRALERKAGELEPPPTAWLWHGADAGPVETAPVETAPNAVPPAAFLDGVAASAAVFTPPDRADALWVQAAAPEPAPLAAGWIAPGGEEQPGPVGWDQGGWIHLEGGRLVPGPAGGARPRWEPPRDTSWLADFARTWAEDRGLVETGDGPLVLSIRSLPAPALVRNDVQVGRDGWSAFVREADPRSIDESLATPLDVDPGAPADVWLAAAGGPLIARTPGQAAWAQVHWGEPQGDPAQVALSLAAFLDGALSTPAEVAEPSARADQGPTSHSPPRWDLAAPPDPTHWLQRGGLTALTALAAALTLLRAATLAPR